jgi:acyl-CoA thioester hydrolase
VISKREIEVRYADTDQMGVVYHANYLVWMEIGRTGLIKDLGFSYAELEAEGIVSPVLDIQISYKKPLRYGETAIIKTWIADYDGFRSIYEYEILTPNGDLAVSSRSTHVCVKKDSFRPISFRRAYPKWHEAYLSAKVKVEE